MKLITKLIVFLVVFAGASTTFAQDTNKFGYIDSQSLLQLMPERQAAEQELEKHEKKLETQLQAMQNELNTKMEDYIAQRDSLSELLLATREKDIQDLQQRIETFRNVAVQDLRKKESDEIRPIIEKAKNAIQQVGEEEGFTYIFDLSTGGVVFVSDNAIDVTNLVKAKLGLP